MSVFMVATLFLRWTVGGGLSRGYQTPFGAHVAGGANGTGGGPLGAVDVDGSGPGTGVTT
jgi:hypothetical protein